MRAPAAVLVLVVSSWGGSFPAAEGADVAEGLCRSIPSRSTGAMTGSGFASRVLDLTGPARDEAVLAELDRGNLPRFLRQLKPVRLSAAGPRGEGHEAVIFVMPDYLAVGSDEDFLRVPLGLDAARRAARRFGFTLPTRKMVDAIYEQAAVRLAPQPMKPGPRMRSTEYSVAHQRSIEAQRAGRPLGELVSGHKKDLVLSTRLLTKRGRVAIYGWHQRGGRPIQPLSTVHGARYADYSHGVRLVSTTVLVDGRPRSIFDVLRDPELAPVMTFEGTIRDAARLMGYDSVEPAERRTVFRILRDPGLLSSYSSGSPGGSYGGSAGP